MIIFEFKKIKKSAIPITLIFFNLVGSLLGAMIYALNRKVLLDGTQARVLWGQTVFYSSQIFTPILIGIICSISCQFEESNKVLLFYIISALVLKVPFANYLLDFLLWSITGWIATITIVTIQIFLSIRLKNFAVPILISAILAIAGLMTLFIGQGLFSIFPYAQIAVGNRARSLVPFTLSEFILFLVVNGAYIFVFYTLAVRQLKKRFI